MAVLINPRAELLGHRNAVLMGRGRRHEVREFPGPLSVKTVLDGSVEWETEDGRFTVDESSFLVLNDGQPYSLRIDAHRPMSTCCLFFESGFVERVRHSLVSAEANLLADPAAAPAHAFQVRLEAGDAQLLPRIRTLARRITRGSASGDWLDEQMMLAARDLVLRDRRNRDLVGRIPAARAATREENLRRLSLAREYMHAHAGSPVDLAGIARAAFLSPYHFHRLFRQTFGETPHAYLRRLRLERAHRMLASGRRSVTETCFETGFASLGSFSSLFRRRFGVPPSRVSAIQQD